MLGWADSYITCGHKWTTSEDVYINIIYLYGFQDELFTIASQRLSVARPVLGYATQVWTPQSIELCKRMERIQRRASKFILNLPFLCNESYQDRLISINLLPISYWHEYLDITFFFKAINGLYSVSSDVLPVPVVPLRLTTIPCKMVETLIQN